MFKAEFRPFKDYSHWRADTGAMKFCVTESADFAPGLPGVRQGYPQLLGDSFEETTIHGSIAKCD
jgi:hypothetical protein